MTKDEFERAYGIPVVESRYMAPDSISLLRLERSYASDEQTRATAAVEEMLRLAKNNPVTFEGVRVLDRHRAWPRMHNIPLPRTKEGDQLLLLVRKMRKELWPEMIAFTDTNLMWRDFESLERRLIQHERSTWTLQDYHWRDGEE